MQSLVLYCLSPWWESPVCWSILGTYGSALNILDLWWICVEWLDEGPMRQCILCLGWVWQSLQVSESEILKGGPSSVFIKSSRWFWQTPKFEHAPIRVGQTTRVPWQKSMKPRRWVRDFPVVQGLSMRLPVQGTRCDSWCRTKIPPCMEACKSERSGACVSQLRPDIART